MSTLTGKVALVTGAGQGIGRAIAKHLLESGMSVVIAELDDEAGQETAADLEVYGDILFQHCDVGKEDDVQALLATTLERFGSLDALINNAGIATPYTGPIEQLELAEWNRRIAANLTGVFLCSKHAVPALRRSRGAIVNIASTRALQSEAHTEAYAASKGGIVALTHAMAISLGPEIRVNAISPGWIAVEDWKKASARSQPVLSEDDHGQHPAGRVGRPQDIASMVAYLIGLESTFITGQNLVIDGGMTRKMLYVE